MVKTNTYKLCIFNSIDFTEIDYSITSMISIDQLKTYCVVKFNDDSNDIFLFIAMNKKHLSQKEVLALDYSCINTAIIHDFGDNPDSAKKIYHNLVESGLLREINWIENDIYAKLLLTDFDDDEIEAYLSWLVSQN